MELFVVRHGEAEDEAPHGGDAARRLTDEGRRKFAEGVAGLAALGVELDRILTSPLTRARQTAEILSRELRGPEPEEQPLLAPGGSLERLLAAAGAAGESVAVVGHEPGLGRLVSLAVTGRTGDGTPLRKGGVALVSFAGDAHPGRGRLVWLATPKLLRRLGR